MKLVFPLFLVGLQLMFIAFKIAGVITWSWWLVALPLGWIPVVVVFLAALGGTLWIIGDICERIALARMTPEARERYLAKKALKKSLEDMLKKLGQTRR